MRLRTLAPAVGVVALLAAPRAAGAQGVRVSLSGMAGYAGSAIVVQGIEEQASGLWYGARIGLELGAITVEASGLRGTLAPQAGTTGFDRDGGEMRGAVRVNVTSWLGVEGGYTLRAFDSPAGYQKWTIPDVGARISAQLGAEGLRGYVRGSYLPGSGAEGLDSPSMGLAVEAGLRLEPPRLPLTLGAFYRLERFDFGTGPAGRLEQFDFLGVTLGLRLGKR